MTRVLLDVRNLKKDFLSGGPFRRRTFLRAVDDITFHINRGETFGLVGESGCGKSTTGRLVLRLLEPSGGEVYYRGIPLFSLKKKEMRLLRSQMQIIFQDPFSSLNPRQTIGDIIAEPLIIHKLGGRAERRKRVLELMEMVGLKAGHARRFPHEFSGGQRQRIGIARALAVNPHFIVADEPVSSLDVSMRAQVLNLMQDLQESLGLTYLFIAHDLNIVRHLSDRVAVMYLGKIVEMGPVARVFHQPLHPYTQSLMKAVKIPDPDVRGERVVLRGEVPSPFELPAGCRFHTRCPWLQDRCRNVEPELKDAGGGHLAGCHLVNP